MTRARPPLLAAFVLVLSSAPVRASTSLSQDFGNMTQWLSDQLVEGLAFNAGENFDPPKKVKGYYLQPDVSFGVGILPLSKKTFPDTPAITANGLDGPNLFPNAVQFPNFALHLRMGLPGNNDLYVRFADATTPPGYKISPTMTAKVQTNSYGAGIRHHFFFGDEADPAIVVGAHYNHVQGRTNLQSDIPVSAPGVTVDTNLSGLLRWNLNSYGVDAIVYQSFGHWTPFGGIGYNHTTGSVESQLILTSADSSSVQPASGDASDHPEQNQGRVIAGGQYEFTRYTVFGSGEIKTIGDNPFKSYIVSVGVALPFEIGCGPMLFCRKSSLSDAGRRLAPEDAPGLKASAPLEEPEAPALKSVPAPTFVPAQAPPPSPAPAAPTTPTKPDAQSAPGFIFVR